MDHPKNPTGVGGKHEPHLGQLPPGQCFSTTGVLGPNINLVGDHHHVSMHRCVRVCVCAC